MKNRNYIFIIVITIVIMSNNLFFSNNVKAEDPTKKGYWEQIKDCTCDNGTAGYFFYCDDEDHSLGDCFNIGYSTPCYNLVSGAKCEDEPAT